MQTLKLSQTMDERKSIKKKQKKNDTNTSKTI